MTGTHNNIWFDFGNAVPQVPIGEPVDVEDIKARLLSNARGVLFHLLPRGEIRNGKFHIGDVQGNRGESLTVELKGSKAGMWHDFATGEGGDIIALWAAVRGFDTRSGFPELMDEIAQWLGVNGAPSPQSPVNASRRQHEDTLGPVTAKWDYHDRNGELIARVYRYDPPGGKQFRPWDVRARKIKAPTPRPLYNIPGILETDRIVLAEGEKAAQALIDTGIAATTAMNGASAPVSKTDWSPLSGKQVLIWPDNDEPGKAYAEKAARAIAMVGAAFVAILEPPADKPEKWDAADAVTDGMDIEAFLEQASRQVADQPEPPASAYTLGAFLGDHGPMPKDLIAPRILTPGGIFVFGGAPKVGKSDFLLALLVHMAAGHGFLGLTPPHPLRIFYLQAEIQYHYLRERLQQMNIPEALQRYACDNLVITAHLKLILNEAGLLTVTNLIRQHFADGVDIIVIDPIRNVFDGGEAGSSENDNNSMLFFLRERVEALRSAINEQAGVILVHHTRKLSKKQVDEDPFQALSGAGSLRGYYSSGAILFRPDEARSQRKLIFELRNGPALATRLVDKQKGQWVEIDASSERLVRKDYGEKLDGERERRGDAILQLLRDEALQGRVYTANQFAEKFENKGGLGSCRGIHDRISVLSTKGFIKFFQNADEYGLPASQRSRYGYLCTEGMELRTEMEDADPDTGEVFQLVKPVQPTHYKCPQSGIVLPVENPGVWVYPQGGEK